MPSTSDYQAIIDSPLGRLGIRATDTHLLALEYLPNTIPLQKPITKIAKKTIAQLNCYFTDPAHQFDLPISLRVSDFQQKVLKAMQRIPIGKTNSYGDIANALSTSPRPIGMACRRNPIPIIIPCHRVIAKNGLGGYNGKTQGKMMKIKRWLLMHERIKLTF